MPESRRVEQVQSPVIPDVAALIRANPGTISLGQGVVHYPPPDQVFEAVGEFGGQSSDHVYHAANGLPRLQQQLAEKLRTENGIELNQDQFVMTTAGSNMGFLNCVLAIADPGDEFILLSPFFFNHEMAIALANCRPVTVPTDEQYQPQLDLIASAITARTRAIVTVSPNNPSGAVYSERDLTGINQLCREHELYHISDEAYEYFTYEEAVHFSPGSLPESRRHTLSLFSFSKSYGMASWRVGYLTAPKHLLAALQKIQDTLLICPPAISQAAALGALRAGPQYCTDLIRDIGRVRHSCLEYLAAIQDVCQVPETLGAFYLLIRLDTDRYAMDIVERLIRDFRVAVIPGNAFGLEDACYVRIAYGALRHETAAAGMERLLQGLKVLIGR